jgi:hypothetical protein
MIQIIYNGVEITDNVAINRCYHDMYASGRSDTLNLRLNDATNLWDKWAPQKGDMIRVEYGAISTGDMFISSVLPENGTFGIMAQAAPPSGFDLQNKSWQQVHLLQIAREIAQRNGLTFSSYGVEDRLYPYIIQDNEGDLHLLSRLASREGCAILVYNKSLILYDERHMEAQEPREVLNIAADGEFKFNDRRFNLYGSCIVENDSYSGTFAVDNGSARIYRPEKVGSIGSNAEAQRFAKNLLRSVNKGCYGGYVRSKILPGYAAGSTVELYNPRTPSWNGVVFVDHLRNDYGKGSSKIFFRKPLEGY